MRGRTIGLAAVGLLSIVVSALISRGSFGAGLFESGLTIVAFTLAAACGMASAAYLIRGAPRTASAAAALARSGFVCASLALLFTCAGYAMRTGALWVWELPAGMLLLLWLIYIGYFLIWSSTDAPDRAARFTAVFAVAAAIDAPFLYLSIRSFLEGRGQPGGTVGQVIASPGGATLLVGLCLSFLALMFYLYEVERARIGHDSVEPSLTNQRD